MTEKLELNLNVVTREAQKNIANAAKEAKKLTKDLTDSRTEGKKFADALKSVGKAAETEFNAMRSASQKLANAMGPELTNAIKQTGGSVDSIVSELRGAGLSFEAIEADVESLADSMKQLNDVNVRTGGSLNKLARDSDNTRSVMANLVGNTGQDLANLAGVSGSAGVALGQLAEYAADGNVGIGGLVKFAGPMAALGLASWGVSKAFESAAEKAEQAAARTQNFKDILASLAEGDTAAAAETLVDNYGGTIEALERWGFTSRDLQSTLEGEDYVIRSLTRALDDMLTRRDELLNKQSSGVDMTRAELEEIEFLNIELGANQKLLSNLIMYQGEYATTEDGIAERTRRLREYNQVGQGTLGWLERLESAYDSVAARGAESSRLTQMALAEQQKRLNTYVDTLEDLPAEEVTEVQAAIDRGAVAEAERLLQQLARTRVANISVVLTNGNERGKGSAVGKGAKGSTSTPSAGATLNGILNPSTSSGGGGGGGSGGGGGGGGVPATDPMAEWDQAMSAANQMGEVSNADYLNYLNMRLGAYDKYSSEYMAIWSKIDDIHKDEIRAQEAAAEAAKRAAEDKIKAAEDAAKAQQDAMHEFDELQANLNSVGELSDEEYRKFLESRLSAYEKYSDEYFRIKRQIMAIDNAAERQQEKAQQEELTRVVHQYLTSDGSVGGRNYTDNRRFSVNMPAGSAREVQRLYAKWGSTNYDV